MTQSATAPKWGDPLRYLTDDRDYPTSEQRELMIFQGGNGDYYVQIVEPGHRILRGVRICMSGGASSENPALARAISDAYRALYDSAHGRQSATPPLRAAPSTDFFEAFEAFTAKPCTICGRRRDWALDGQLQAVCYRCGNPTPASPDDREKLDALLTASLKPEEIAGPEREARARELVSWFARYTRGMANPKWLVSHACELAYYVATIPRAPLACPPSREGADIEAELQRVYAVNEENARLYREADDARAAMERDAARSEAEIDEILDAALTGLRDPMTLDDAYRVRTMLTHQAVSRKKAKVLAARAADSQAPNRNENETPHEVHSQGDTGRPRNEG